MQRGETGKQHQVTAAPRQHAGQNGGGTGDGSAEIDGDDLIPGAFLQLDQRRIAGDASRANEQIHSPPVEIRTHSGGIRDVKIVPARRGKLPLRVLKSRDKGAAKPAAATGDDELIHACGMLEVGHGRPARGVNAMTRCCRPPYCGGGTATGKLLVLAIGGGLA